MRIAVLLGVGVLLLFSLFSPVEAEDWPVWRGPAGNGISAEKDWSPEAVANGKILWRAKVGVGHASFAVGDGRVYTMGNAENQDTVFCFDAVTGKEIWKYSYACRAGNYAGPRSTPTLDGAMVYTFSREGHLHCLDAKTGKVKWMKKAKSGMPKWGIASSPIIHDKLVIVNAGTSGTAYVKKSGKLAWSAGGGIPGYASPVAMGEGKNLSFLIFGQNALLCVSGKSGQKRWSFPWVTKYDVNAGDPVLVGEKRIFISSGYGKGCAMLERTKKGVKEVWRNTSMKNHMASTILYEGYLYGISDAGRRGADLVCLDAKDGSTKWTKGGFGKGALMLADGKLIVLSERGIHLAIAEATPKAYTEIARAKVLDGHTWTMPILANGRIYCRNDAGAIVCVDATAK